MRFNVAWASVLTQNVALRSAILSLCLAVVILLVVVTKLSLREPLIIERSCFSQVINPSSSERTEVELLAFAKEALSQRFDSNPNSQDRFLSVEENAFRDQEQKNFKEKEIRQQVLVHGLKSVSGSEVTIDADRLLSVGSVRSVLSFPLKISVATVSRSRGNPYGLQALKVTALDKDPGSEKKLEK